MYGQALQENERGNLRAADKNAHNGAAESLPYLQVVLARGL